MPSNERAPLSRDAILAAAIDLADLDGVRALSMRNLARRLGFEVMALYNHIANKNELLALMADEVAKEIEAPPDDADPLEAIRAIAIATRVVLVNHPWAAELWFKHLPGPARTDHMELKLRILAASGLSEDMAHHGFHAIDNHVHGYTLQEQGMQLAGSEEVEDKAHQYMAGLSDETHPHTIAHMHQHLEGGTFSSFELVLDLIIDGLVRIDNSGHPGDAG